MEVDLQVLNDRVSRLEALFGPLPASNCIHGVLFSLRARLRALVSDEVVAAARTVRMLSHTAPHIRNLSQARRARAARAGHVVDCVAAMLQELDALTQGVRLGELCTTAMEGAELQKMNNKVRKLEEDVEEEEKQVDELLAEFELATKRLNARIVALAEMAQKEKVCANA